MWQKVAAVSNGGQVTLLHSVCNFTTAPLCYPHVNYSTYLGNPEANLLTKNLQLFELIIYFSLHLGAKCAHVLSYMSSLCGNATITMQCSNTHTHTKFK